MINSKRTRDVERQLETKKKRLTGYQTNLSSQRLFLSAEEPCRKPSYCLGGGQANR